MRTAGYAKTTRQQYVRSLRHAQWGLDDNVEDFTADDILLWLDHRSQHVGPSSVNVNVCALKYYFGRILGQPDMVNFIPQPRRPRQLGDLLTIAELRELFAAASSAKHHAVLALLFGLGLRAGEVGRIRLHDFDRQQATLIIRQAKGGKSRTLPYGPVVRHALAQYFRQERPADYLFVSGTRKAEDGGLSVRGVQYIVRQTLARTTIKKKVCPHVLRHCFAVHYLNEGGSLLRLKELLGHALLSTTFRYLSYAKPQLVDVPSPLHRVLDVPVSR